MAQPNRGPDALGLGGFNFGSATVEFAFAPAERDVYSWQYTPKDLAPLGAKPRSETVAAAVKGDCAPTELGIKEEHWL